ncbi:Metallo-beta-lactamase family protein [Myxococcus hansupus]|uniref:Metallo-beta-lactamase family protein n=1 Tax=Pseudomyxococcus hansupus TaxID=1297742 RepID=A0A0H4X8F9_9BACT|nr:MBL fold metallo-hydrolase [Myxococcus hansupus]AKQ64132.1 Metallo-beta-lactamase family protein [Myxococcus hansupus]
MLFRQLFDTTSSTYTYLIGDEEQGMALLIDPVAEKVERDLSLLRELGLSLTHVLDTHVHADHVTASGLLRARTGAKVVGGAAGAPCADLHVQHGDTLRVGAFNFQVLGTPGHTDDSVSYLLGDRVFTGDALLIRGNGRTDFQNGNAGTLYDSITRVLFSLPDETLVYPAHDYKGMTVTTIGEEKRHNPRVAGRSREGFIQLMNSLGLPKPKLIDVAVPANRACGLVRPDGAHESLTH